jgi:hypothetical protein
MKPDKALAIVRRDDGVIDTSAIKALTFYNSARAALEKACSIDEAKEIRNKAIAFQAYAVQAKNYDVQIWAAEIKARAERKAGEMLYEMEQSDKRATRGGDRKSKLWKLTLIQTLEDLGITKEDSHNWRTLATPKPEQFERDVQRLKEAGITNMSGELRREFKRPAQVAREQEFKLTLKLPKGTYDVIVLDPDWDESIFELSDEIRMLLDTSAQKDSHIFLWVPNEYLPMGFRIIENCSLQYISTFVWHKPGMGVNCEFAIYAHRGGPKAIDAEKVSVCFSADLPKLGKPDDFYEQILITTKSALRLDAYAKRKVAGFTSWAKSA